MKRKKEDICSICGLLKEMSFEHYPPKSAMNKTPIQVKDYNNLINKNSVFYGKSRRINQGLGGYKLCKDCNNKTGSWYARDYINLVDLISPILIDQKESDHLVYKVKVKPLNFFKQVLTIFLCMDQKLGIIRDFTKDTNFILNRKERNLSDKIQIYMYATLSDIHRNFGIMTTTLNNNGEMSVGNFAEFNFPPFGFLLTLETKPPNHNMKNITPYKYLNYNDEIIDEFKLPILKINRPLPPAHYG